MVLHHSYENLSVSGGDSSGDRRTFLRDASCQWNQGVGMVSWASVNRRKYDQIMATGFSCGHGCGTLFSLIDTCVTTNLSGTRCNLSHSLHEVRKNAISLSIYLHWRRLIQSMRDSSMHLDLSLLSLRVGTKFGVVSHTFRVESKDDLDYWTQGITQALHHAVMCVKEIAFRKCRQWTLLLSIFVDCLACQWNKRACKLCLHYEHGFTLFNEMDNGAQVRLLWQEPFEKLGASSDDNNHLLTLDFHGEEGVVVGEHPTCGSENESFLLWIGTRFWYIAQTVHLPSPCISLCQSCSNWIYWLKSVLIGRVLVISKQWMHWSLSLTLSDMLNCLFSFSCNFTIFSPSLRC